MAEVLGGRHPDPIFEAHAPGDRIGSASQCGALEADRAAWWAVASCAVLRHAGLVHPPVSLADLYLRVPAAEEEDLLEQRAAEQQQEELLCEYARWMDLDLPELEPVPTESDIEHVAAPTHAQALGSFSTSWAPSC